MDRLSLPERTKPYVMAHRGNRVLCPENTLASFVKAFEEGTDILETDLHLSADGVFMCIHDATVDRTTDGSGAVAEKTLAELKSLSASYRFNGFERERIPTLAETTSILPAGVGLALELKTDRFLEPEVCARLVAELRDAGVLSRTIVLSFSLPRLQTVQAVEPAIPMGWITMAKLSPHADPEVLGPFWPAVFLNPFYVRRAHQRGQLVCPLDPTPDSRLWYYKWLGCDAIVTDNPGATLQAMRRISFKHSV
ncbi:MAG: glycerophosphodiester phosphodiesterase family protein [Anaerolineaceae bacterium]